MAERRTVVFDWLAAVAIAVIMIAPTACARHAPEPQDASRYAIAVSGDPLPSWNDGQAKRAIQTFVRDVTAKDGSRYVEPDKRIAVFDNDGTLWNEEPIVQVAFGVQRIRDMAAKDPALAARAPYKAFVDKGYAALAAVPQDEALKALTASWTGMSEDEFATEASAFLHTARHPRYGVRYMDLTYLPMRELLAFLRANGFQIFINTGGEVGFLRAVAGELYGVPPQNVIGTYYQDEVIERNGRLVAIRSPKMGLFNDQMAKVSGLSRHLGRRPILVGGNAGGQGDIAQMRYSREGVLPSLQMMIVHDDAVRESDYAAKDPASLEAARHYGFTLVSMKRDWNRVFALPDAAVAAGSR